MRKNKIRRCQPQRKPEGLLFRNLEFAYVPVGYNWLERFVLNNKHKKALKLARKRGLVILAANEKVAFDLHHYYRVDPAAIRIVRL
ncbi:MAG: hypothetical protein K5651_05595 [Bacteroidales bacterium]|nr:hypothetical protein [Bacteroidales bacterium]